MRPLICNTGQHEQLCGETLAWFGITAEAKLDAMRPNQSHAALQGRLLSELDAFLDSSGAQDVIVQGDTIARSMAFL